MIVSPHGFTFYQAQAVKDAWKTKLELGQTYAIVEAKWWNAFKAYVGFDDMKCLVSLRCVFRCVRMHT